MSGSFASETFNYLDVRVLKCKNETSEVVCASPEEITQTLTDSQFNMFLVNSNVDFDEYKNSITPYIDENFYWDLNPLTHNKVKNGVCS